VHALPSRGAPGREAYSELVAAEERADVEGLERLAIAAHMIGAEDWVDRWTDVCRAHEERGEHARAARCAFWLAYGLLTGGQVAHGSGWLGRAHEILEAVDGSCAERGLLLIPDGVACCDEQPTRAVELFTEAAFIGRRHSDHDVLAMALMGQGQARLVSGVVREALAALDEAMLIVTSRASPRSRRASCTAA
jgi:hypothetical protein